MRSGTGSFLLCDCINCRRHDIRIAQQLMLSKDKFRPWRRRKDSVLDLECLIVQELNAHVGLANPYEPHEPPKNTGNDRCCDEKSSQRESFRPTQPGSDGANRYCQKEKSVRYEGDCAIAVANLENRWIGIKLRWTRISRPRSDHIYVSCIVVSGQPGLATLRMPFDVPGS